MDSVPLLPRTRTIEVEPTIEQMGFSRIDPWIGIRLGRVCSIPRYDTREREDYRVCTRGKMFLAES